jgi:hypothetical protein
MTFYVMIITDVEVLVGSSKAVGTVHDITGSNVLISDALTLDISIDTYECITQSSFVVHHASPLTYYSGSSL